RRSSAAQASFASLPIRRAASMIAAAAPLAISSVNKAIGRERSLKGTQDLAIAVPPILPSGSEWKTIRRHRSFGNWCLAPQLAEAHLGASTIRAASAAHELHAPVVALHAINPAPYIAPCTNGISHHCLLVCLTAPSASTTSTLPPVSGTKLTSGTHEHSRP